MPTPRDQRGYQCGPDFITALAVYGTGAEMPMLATESLYSFGREEHCDLRPVGPMANKLVARVQARIDRVRTNSSSNKSLHVTDISAGRNDMVIDGIASKEFDMGAGDSFYIGKARYVAMTDEMRSARVAITDILGIGQHKAIDDVLIAAVQEPVCHIVLTGEPGCDQTRFGEVIHYASHRRHRRFHAVDKDATLDSFSRQVLLDTAFGTLLVPLYQRGKLDPRFAEAILEPEIDLRLIVCALSPGKVAASFLPNALQRPYEVEIRPLRDRLEEIPQLLDKWLIKRRSPLRFAQLRPELQAAQLKYKWRGNLEELREWADLLTALARYATRYELKKHSESTDSRLKRIEKDKLNIKIQFPLVSQKQRA